MISDTTIYGAVALYALGASMTALFIHVRGRTLWRDDLPLATVFIVAWPLLYIIAAFFAARRLMRAAIKRH